MNVVSPADDEALASAHDVTVAAARAVGTPVRLELLKDKPGRRRAWRAVGDRRAVIVKTYASDRAATVAARLLAIADDTAQVATPRVLDVDPERRLVVLTEVPGQPWRRAITAADVNTSHLVGASIAAWHEHWNRRPPASLAAHTVDAELRAIRRQAPTPGVLAEATTLSAAWQCATVVHRDLYEEQVVLAGRDVGLIDLDDAAVGPPELDVGNVLAHLDLLGLRHGQHLASQATRAFLDGYRATSRLDEDLLSRCRRLTQLRLACIHPDAAAAFSSPLPE